MFTRINKPVLEYVFATRLGFESALEFPVSSKQFHGKIDGIAYFFNLFDSLTPAEIQKYIKYAIFMLCSYLSKNV